MATELSLNCWIEGLDNANAFLVDILSSKTIGHLKGAIKQKKDPVLNHIDADQLEIWKVSDRAMQPPLPICNDTTRLQLRNPLRSGEIAKTLDKGIPDADELDPVQKLSRYFLETPVEEMVHLIVRLPGE